MSPDHLRSAHSYEYLLDDMEPERRKYVQREVCYYEQVGAALRSSVSAETSDIDRI